MSRTMFGVFTVTGASRTELVALFDTLPDANRCAVALRAVRSYFWARRHSYMVASVPAYQCRDCGEFTPHTFMCVPCSNSYGR